MVPVYFAGIFWRWAMDASIQIGFLVQRDGCEIKVDLPGLMLGSAATENPKPYILNPDVLLEAGQVDC